MKKAVVKRRKNRLATPTARKVEGRTKLALMEFSPPHAPGGGPISYHKKVMLVSSFTRKITISGVKSSLDTLYSAVSAETLWRWEEAFTLTVFHNAVFIAKLR